MKDTNSLNKDREKKAFIEESDLIDLEALKDVRPKKIKDKVVFDYTPPMNSLNREAKKPYLKLKSGSTWEFEWNDRFSCWTHLAKKHLYRIFIDGVTDRKYDWQIPMVWIGQFVPHYEDGSDDHSWITVEKEIGADELHIDRGVIKFI